MCQSHKNHDVLRCYQAHGTIQNRSGNTYNCWPGRHQCQWYQCWACRGRHHTNMIVALRSHAAQWKRCSALAGGILRRLTQEGCRGEGEAAQGWPRTSSKRRRVCCWAQETAWNDEQVRKEGQGRRGRKALLLSVELTARKRDNERSERT